MSPWTTARGPSRGRPEGGGERCAASLPVPIPRSSPPDFRPSPRAQQLDDGARRTSRVLRRPRSRELVMTDRRLVPLTALSTLTRRPAGRRPCAARRPARSAGHSGALPDGGQRRLRVGPPGGDAGTAAESRQELAEGEDRLAWLGLTGRSRTSSVSWPSSTTCPSSPSRTRSRPTSGRSSSGTATRCSSSSRPPGTWTRWRRSSSASCTCSWARTSSSRCGTASRRTCRGCAGGWRATRRCWPRAARRCCTRRWTPSSTGTGRWSRAGQRHRRDRDRGLPG